MTSSHLSQTEKRPDLKLLQELLFHVEEVTNLLCQIRTSQTDTEAHIRFVTEAEKEVEGILALLTGHLPAAAPDTIN